MNIIKRGSATAANGTSLALIFIGALVYFLCFRDGVGGFGLFIFVTVIIAITWWISSRTLAQAVSFVLAMAVASGWLVRDSLALQLGSVILVATLLLWAVTVAKHRPLLDVSAGDAIAGCRDFLVGSLGTPVWALRGFGRRAPRQPADDGLVLRLVFVAVPLLILVAVLLGTADGWFSRLLAVDPVPFLVGWGVFLVGIAVLAVAVRNAVSIPGPRIYLSSWSASLAETVVVVGGLGLLLAVFSVSQLWSTAGTPAPDSGYDYATSTRSGYVQLLVVAAIVTFTIVVYDKAVPTDRPTHRRTHQALALILVALTLILLSIALRRLFWYSDVFGLTMLRLLGIVIAGWIAVILVLLVFRITRVGARRGWLAPSGLLALTVIWLVFAALNPQQIIVEFNTSHVASEDMDLEYLTSLSYDGVPELIARASKLQPDQAAYVRAALCPRLSQDSAFMQQNFANRSARSQLTDWCR